MLLRSVALVGALVGAILAADVTTPRRAAAASDDMYEFLAGGAPVGRSRYSLFNMNLPRATTVSYPSSHRPEPSSSTPRSGASTSSTVTAPQSATASASAALASPGRAPAP